MFVKSFRFYGENETLFLLNYIFSILVEYLLLSLVQDIVCTLIKLLIFTGKKRVPNIFNALIWRPFLPKNFWRDRNKELSEGAKSEKYNESSSTSKRCKTYGELLKLITVYFRNNRGIVRVIIGICALKVVWADPSFFTIELFLLTLL